MVDHASAMNERVIKRDESPYADFSTRTPFGRRSFKTMRLRAWVLQLDGFYGSVESSGPPDLGARHACHLIYRAIPFMKVQYEAFKNLVNLHPECYHLYAQVEDRD